MKVECLKDKIKQVVNQTERVTGKNLTLPILNSILIEAKNNKLKIKATNLEVGLEMEMPALVEEDGVVAVNASILSNFLNNLSQEEKIKIDLNNGNLKIATKKSTTTLKSVNIDDFPIIPQVASEEVFKIEAKVFIDGLKSVLFAAAVSDIKPEISSVYIHQFKGDLYFVATDSFRLAEKKIKIQAEDFPAIIIPFRNISEIIKTFEAEDGGMELKTDKNQLSIFTNNIHFTTRIIDGVYPDYRQILPKSFKTEIIIPKTELLNAFKLANIFSDRFNQIDLSVKTTEQEIIIHSNNQDVGENTLNLKVEIKGEAIDLSLNVKYLLDCLGIINEPNILLQLNEKNRPLLVSGQSNDSFHYLVMPVNR